MKWRVAFLWCVGFAACDEPAPTPESEVAAELRALRAVLVERGQSSGGVASPDPAGIAAAMQPLREVLDGLVRQQGELQQRQVALTQELQRWSQLLVDGVGTARRDEASALAGRLQKMEAALKEQEERHQKVEALLQGALDRTADRLEEFLRRVEPGTPAHRGDGGNAGPSVDRPKSIGAVPGARRNQNHWWWGGVGAMGLGLGALCFRRWRRPGAANSVPVRRDRSEVAAPADQGVQEIWAAAALLGEAVGRLRESGAQPAGDAVEDLVVLDDDLFRQQHEQKEERANARALEQAPRRGTVRLRAREPERAAKAIERILAGDPRVLRSPTPSVRVAGDTVEVSFVPFPGLPAGERAALEQTLADACR